MNPAIDMVLVCGGFFWFLAACYLVVGVKLDPQTALLLSIAGNVFFTDAHQPATLYRVYSCARTRKQVGVPVTAWGVLVIALGGAALFSGPFTSLLLNITVAWSMQHLLAQSYGISLIYCYKRQYFMTEREKQSLWLLIHTLLVFLLIRWFSVSPTKQLTFGFYLPEWQVLPEWVMTTAGIAVQLSVLYFVGMVVRKWVRERKLFPIPALVVVLTTVSVPIMFGGSRGNAIIGIFMQNFFHSAQYIVVTTAYFLKEKGLPEGVPFSKIATQLWSKRCLSYFGFVLLLGLVLAVALPAALSTVGFAHTAAIAYCVLNLHHYVTDAMIWKMRDPTVRKLLVA
jgi:hypothetical protein